MESTVSKEFLFYQKLNLNPFRNRLKMEFLFLGLTQTVDKILVSNHFFHYIIDGVENILVQFNSKSIHDLDI